MKSKLILTCTMVAISLCLLACSPASKQVSVNVSRDDFKREQNNFSKEVEVPVDGSLTIALYSCPSEGRQWSEAQINDQTVLQQTDHKLVMPEYKGDMPPAPGTSGKEVWTFHAEEKGKSTIWMEYRRSWEQGVEPAKAFTLTVVVK